VRNVTAGLVLTMMLVGAACSKDPAVVKQQFLESGSRYMKAGQYRHAIIEYRNAIQLDARFGAARAGLAEAYARSGEAARALEEYVRAADLLPKDVEIQLEAGRYLLAARRPQDALGRAELALKLRPNDARVHILHGNALAGLNSFDKALAAIEEAIRLAPGQAEAYSHLGAIELVRGRREEAEAAFKRAVLVEPKSVEARLALGNFYWATGRLTETRQAFEDVLQLQPASQPANRAMAALSMASGKPEQAETYLKRIAETSKDAGSVYALAEYYMLMARPKEAISRLEPLAAQTPAPPGVRQRLARAHAAAGDRPKAHAIVAELTKQNPRDAEAQLIKGQLLSDEGHRDEALAAVRSAVEADPTSVRAQFALGQLYVARGDSAGAEAAFREVLKLNPRAAAAQVALARLQLAGGNAAESVRAADDAAKTEPGSVAAKLALVRALLATKDLDRAERELATLRRDYPNLASMHALSGALAAERKDVPAARAAFERAQALDPAGFEGVAGLVALHLQDRNYAEAKALVDARLRNGPARPQLLILAAQTYAASQDREAAERMLRQAIDKDPTFLPAYSMLGQLYVAQNKLDEARREFDELARRQSRPIGALIMSGMISQAQGNTPQAKERYTKALAVDPRSAVAANNLAWIYADGGENLDEALQLAQTAATALPDVPEIMDTLGWVYYKKNLPQLAIPLFSRSAEKAPKNAVYEYHLGLAYRQAGDTARARASFERAIARSPDQATASAIRAALGEIPVTSTRQ
jgi:tetratricopeptide (TPR) repeat protein